MVGHPTTRAIESARTSTARTRARSRRRQARVAGGAQQRMPEDWVAPLGEAHAGAFIPLPARQSTPPSSDSHTSWNISGQTMTGVIREPARRCSLARLPSANGTPAIAGAITNDTNTKRQRRLPRRRRPGWRGPARRRGGFVAPRSAAIARPVAVAVVITVTASSSDPRSRRSRAAITAPSARSSDGSLSRRTSARTARLCQSAAGPSAGQAHQCAPRAGSRADPQPARGSRDNGNLRGDGRMSVATLVLTSRGRACRTACRATHRHSRIATARVCPR
jgi:hypothetical protein